MKNRALALVAVPSLMAAGGAIAAVPAGLQTAIDTATVDVGTVALGVLLITVAILVYKWFRKAF